MPETSLRPDHVSTEATTRDAAALRSGIEGLIQHLDGFAGSGNAVGRMTGGDVVRMTADHRVLGEVVVKHTSLNRTSDGVHDVSVAMEDADRPRMIPIRLAVRTVASAPLHPPATDDPDRDAPIRRIVDLFLSCLDAMSDPEAASGHLLHLAANAVSIAAIDEVQSRDRAPPKKADRTRGTLPMPYRDGSISVSTLPFLPLTAEDAPTAAYLKIDRAEHGVVHASMTPVQFIHDPDPEDAVFRLRAGAALIDVMARRRKVRT